MKYARLKTLAALAFAVACSENSSTLVAPEAPEGPLFAASGSPHFIGNATDCNQSGTTLVCSFKETGLGSGVTVTIQITVNAQAVYQCINGGGTNPNDPKKSTINAQVSASGTFTSGKNGNVVSSLTVNAPPSDISCPPGQQLTLISATFFPAATIADLTSGASISISDF